MAPSCLRGIPVRRIDRWMLGGALGGAVSDHDRCRPRGTDLRELAGARPAPGLSHDTRRLRVVSRRARDAGPPPAPRLSKAGALTTPGSGSGSGPLSAASGSFAPTRAPGSSASTSGSSAWPSGSSLYARGSRLGVHGTWYAPFKLAAPLSALRVGLSSPTMPHSQRSQLQLRPVGRHLVRRRVVDCSVHPVPALRLLALAGRSLLRRAAQLCRYILGGGGAGRAFGDGLASSGAVIPARSARRGSARRGWHRAGALPARGSPCALPTG